MSRMLARRRGVLARPAPPAFSYADAVPLVDSYAGWAAYRESGGTPGVINPPAVSDTQLPGYSGGQAGQITAYNTLAHFTTGGLTAVDMSAPGGSIHFAIYIKNPGTLKVGVTAKRVWISAGESGASNRFAAWTDRCKVVTLDPGNRYITNSGNWCRISLPVADFQAIGANPMNMAAVKQVRLEFNSLNVGTLPVEVGLSPWITYHPPRLAKAKAIIWLDDGNDTAFDVAKPILEPLGLPAVLAPNVERIGSDPTAMTVAEVEQLRALGWQVGSHALNGPGHAAQTGAQLTTQLDAVVAAMKARGYPRWQDFAYWGGLVPYGDNIGPIKEHFRTARYAAATEPQIETLPPGDPWRMKCYLTGAGETAAGHWIPYAQKAIAAKGIAQFCFHSNITDGEFAALAQWLHDNAATIETVTMDRLMARHARP